MPLVLRDIGQKIEIGAKYTIAIWLLVGYFLANTVWAKVTLGSVPFLDFNYDWPSRFPIVAAIAFIGIGISYWGEISKHKWSLGFGVLVTVFLFPYMLALFVRPASVRAENQYGLVISDFFVGLIAARMCTTSSRACKLLFFLGFAQALYGCYDFASGHDSFISGTVLRAGGTFRDPFDLYVLMLVCLPISIGLFCEARSPSRIIYVTGAAGMYVCLILTFYRAGILAAMLGVCWLLYRVNNRKLIWLISVVLMTASVMLVWHARTSGSTNVASAERSVSGRYYMWKCGVSIFLRHPINGVGVCSLRIPPDPTYRDPSLEPAIQPNNMLVYWLSERGILGGVMYFAFPVVVYFLIRGKRNEASAAIGAAWIGIGIVSMFDTPFGVGSFVFEPVNVLAAFLMGTTLLPSVNSAEELEEPCQLT